MDSSASSPGDTAPGDEVIKPGDKAPGEKIGQGRPTAAQLAPPSSPGDPGPNKTGTTSPIDGISPGDKITPDDEVVVLSSCEEEGNCDDEASAVPATPTGRSSRAKIGCAKEG
mmetsp:Transcript_10360/g.23301  ORF Transcript_10360/g.23301 Transcript_10360/m.23301 type:complete len:113 (-) Transcript_10360:74-412(-)